jgi:hypothetical protein
MAMGVLMVYKYIIKYTVAAKNTNNTHTRRYGDPRSAEARERNFNRRFRGRNVTRRIARFRRRCRGTHRVVHNGRKAVNDSRARVITRAYTYYIASTVVLFIETGEFNISTSIAADFHPSRACVCVCV